MSEDKIEIIDFDERYLTILQHYEKIIKSYLLNAEVNLIGSMAVPMKGKAEIDILVIVEGDLEENLKKFEDIWKYRIFDGVGYVRDYQFGIETEFHFVEKGHAKISRSAKLIAVLRSNATLRREFEKFKESCNGISRDEYRKKKAKFMEENKLI